MDVRAEGNEIGDQAMLGMPSWWHINRIESNDLVKRAESLEILRSRKSSKAKEITILFDQLINEIIKVTNNKYGKSKAVELFGDVLKFKKDGRKFQVHYTNEKGHLGLTIVGYRPMKVLRQEHGQVFYPSSEPFSTVPGIYVDAEDSKGEVHHFQFSMYDMDQVPSEPIYGQGWIVDIPEYITIIPGEKLSDEAMLNDQDLIQNNSVLFFTGLTGSLHDGKISVLNGQLKDASFINQPIDAAMTGEEIGIAAAITAAVAGGAYYYWSRYTLSGNLYRLNSDDSEVRQSAAEALGEIKNSRAVEPLIGRLGDNDWKVQVAAIKALGEIKDLRAVEPLLDLLKFFSDVTFEALEKIGGDKVDLVRKIKMRLETTPNFPKKYILKSIFEILRLREEGYDFIFLYEPEKGHIIGDPTNDIYWIEDAFMGNYGNPNSYYMIDSPEKFKIIRGVKLSDKATLAAPNETDVGGIDMNNIEMKKQGQGASIQFDPMDMDAIIKENIQGFVPVIINVTPVNSILPIFGLEPRKDEEGYKVSQLN